ncbi:MAG: UvrD-helicase domain-containing protein, partial [Planctomycetota bacterium]
MSGTRDQEARDSALSDFEHNLVLTAGAGTGKTSLLTGRVVCALLGKGCEPEELLITTFTEKAAAEMAARVEAALVALSEGRPAPDTDAGRAWRVLRHRFEIEARWIRDGARALLDRDALPEVGTFHAFCLRTLGEFQREAGLAPDARIADADETLREF